MNSKPRQKVAKTIGKLLLYVYIAAFVLGSVIVFVPTTKEMAVIKVVPAIANNENLGEVGNKLVVLAEEWLKELRPNKDSEDNQ